MKNTTKVKITITTCKVALLYNDNTSKICDEILIGKYSLNSARKYLKSGEHSSDYANVKNVEVLAVETNVKIFEHDTVELYTFLNE